MTSPEEMDAAVRDRDRVRAVTEKVREAIAGAAKPLKFSDLDPAQVKAVCDPVIRAALGLHDDEPAPFEVAITGGKIVVKASLELLKAWEGYSAGELRVLGFKFPEHVPDVAVLTRDGTTGRVRFEHVELSFTLESKAPEA